MTREPRSQLLLRRLAGVDRIYVVTHDNPDPDALAAGWALVRLFRECATRPVRFFARGAILRAENAQLMRLTRPPLELVNTLPSPARAGVVLVDSQWLGLLETVSEQPDRLAVIDHHERIEASRGADFRDIRTSAAATASIAAGYLHDQGITPSRGLATAIIYAIDTETDGPEVHHSQLDRAIVRWATEWADPETLAAIQNAPLSRDYFGDLVLALQNTFLYQDAAVCIMPRAGRAEITGELADLLIRTDGVERVLCAAGVGEDVVVSARAGQEDGAALVRATLEGLGYGGGHRHRAGGKIGNALKDGAIPQRLAEQLRKRWLRACGLSGQPGQRLVSKREIVRNLR